LNIASNSCVPDNSWLCNTALDHTGKSESERSWVLDDYGSFIWRKTKEATSDNAIYLTNSQTSDDAKDAKSTQSNSASPFNINDWLVVVDNEYDESPKTDNFTDDGSSIVVLSIND